MSQPIRIFICYKKKLAWEEQGQQVRSENTKAGILHEILQAVDGNRYDPWIDEERLDAGAEWENTIYQRLLASDVLLVAIGPGTSASDWVKREIALAKAFGISIVPLGYDLTLEGLAEELRLLGITQIQGRVTQNIRFKNRDALVREIEDALESARARTRIAQTELFGKLEAQRKATVARAPDVQRAHTVPVQLGGHPMKLHVASGDMTNTNGIDVLVNSENNYMQMARFFESRTVSSLLRRKGARIAGGRYVDAVQQELDLQLGDRSRPVQAGEAFVTSTGAPDSKLYVDVGTRYVIHVAAVQALDAEARVVPYSDDDRIRDCVKSCLSKLREVNTAEGVISPPGSDQRREQERLAAAGNGRCRSILFPLFGTGQGGATTEAAIVPMLDGLRQFFDRPMHRDLAESLEDIYFAAFTQPDVEVVRHALTKFAPA